MNASRVVVDMFEDLFYYDETSPSCLRWKVTISSGQGRRVMVRPGDVAGGKNARYWHVQYKGKKYRCHRIIWEITTGVTPDRVDHIDGNSFNNKFKNLRECTQKINSENRSKSSANTSGATGVHITKSHCVAFIKTSGKRKDKSFSISRFGLMPAFKMAHDCRNKMIEELNKNGAAYTERHGK